MTFTSFLYQQFKVLDININGLCMILDFRNGPRSKNRKGKYLKKVVKIAKNNFQKLDFVRASTMLGDIYNEKVSILCFLLIREKFAEF